MINEEKLRLVLIKLKEKYNFDVDAVLETVMKMAALRNVLTKDELADLVDVSITEYMNNKAMDVAKEEAFGNDKHQLAGTIAIVIAKNKDSIKKAFLEASKNVDLLQKIENDISLKEIALNY